MRRQTGIVIALIWILVCGGLTWATYSAIQLEEFESATRKSLSTDRAKALAISRLDAIIEPVLARERQRPYTSFRPKYKTAKAFDASSGEELSDVVVPSPLEYLPGPDWILLHFQVSESRGWSSPQVPGHLEESTIPAGAIPLQNRSKEAGSENWLIAMKNRFTLPQLLEEFEFALTTEIESRRAYMTERLRGSPDARATAQSPSMLDNLSELARRAARAQQLEKESFPLARCEPEKVALENLEGTVAAGSITNPSATCVEVAPNLMMPVWLDVTLEDRIYLALLRSVTVQTSRFCVMQGVLIDWERLRENLILEIKDLFPDAEIVPVLRSNAKARSLIADLLQTVPARLDIGPIAAAPATLTSSLRNTLAVAWLTTLFGLAAVTYGTIKYVNITQRRMHFITAVTHELRTPLTSFQLYSDLLADMKDEDPKRRHQYAERLQSESRRLARLVENVLAYSHIGDAGVRLHGRPSTASEIIDAATTAMADKCKAAGKKMIIENKSKPGETIETDVEFVVQILANLLENACKYSSAATDPSIWLRSVPNDLGGLDIEVEDAGPGVSPGDRKSVFEPFRRSDAARATGSGGVGLGLSLSRYWAECLGGRLTLRKGPRNPNAFSCFVLSLPRIIRP